MRKLLFICSLLLVLQAPAQPPGARLATLPAGALANGRYTNDALGLAFQVPAGWDATTDPGRSAILDSRKANGPANRCSRVLLSFFAPDKVEGRFNSAAALFVIDPQCLTKTPFPASLEDKDALGRTANAIIRPFANSPFISPHGVDVSVFLRQNHIVLQLTGNLTINALEGPHPSKQELLKINTSLAFTEARGYWIAWGYTASDASLEQLDTIQIRFDPVR